MRQKVVILKLRRGGLVEGRVSKFLFDCFCCFNSFVFDEFLVERSGVHV